MKEIQFEDGRSVFVADERNHENLTMGAMETGNERTMVRQATIALHNAILAHDHEIAGVTVDEVLGVMPDTIRKLFNAENIDLVTSLRNMNALGYYAILEFKPVETEAQQEAIEPIVLTGKAY